MSSVRINHVQYEIIRSVELSATKPSGNRRRSECTIAVENASAVGAHAEKSWTTTLVVSPAETPNLSYCSVISASYYLKVEAILPFPHFNIKICCPLTFGTVPLTETNTNMTGPSRQLNSYATAPPSVQTVESGEGLAQSADSALPSYEDAVLKSDNS
ncbi:hypothetical protein ILUMI_06054 [Ignelater luminosus]|uniref:Arrestin C-terminal-like domain-containing protein n=1 Tax=Ignelater luminosus TaxID=2038154 RepID=A0A8K0GI42_IGNLU|nr:hypothetical protein ILUMI_06054 [Ignelater luminosus]